MDAHTLELLEFAALRDRLANYAASSLGKERVRLLEPLTDPTAIRRRQRLVQELSAVLDRGDTLPFGGLHDVRLSVRRAQIGAILTAEQLLEIANTLNCTGAAYRFRMRLDGQWTALIDLLTPIEDHGPVAKSISGCIDGRGQVVDSASDDLARVRRQLAELEERVQSQIRRLLRDPELRKALRYPSATVAGDHFVLPVAVNYRQMVSGVVHRTSSTGETLFIEPASVAHLSAERALLKAEEDREIRRILRGLTEQIGKIAKPLAHALELLGQLDFLTAIARFGREGRMSIPDLSDEGRLWLRQARHPLLEHWLQAAGQASVPIDLRLGYDFRLMVITGPNTGGKTVTLKTAGLLTVMAHCGLPIPAADGSVVPFVRDVLADIGDEQSLQQSLSTFSSHMSRIADILRRAGPDTLVLLDELGAGTDPTEGAALGRAILDALDRTECRAMVTTHLGDLKTYAFANAHAENAAVEFDVETLRPTYRLQIGRFGKSNALRIARRLDVPKEVLRRARRYLKRRQRRAPELDRLEALRSEAEQARAAALAATHDAERQRDEYRARLEALERAQVEAERLRSARANLRPNDRVRVERFDQPGRIVRIDHAKHRAIVSVGLGQWEIPLDEIHPLEPGSSS